MSRAACALLALLALASASYVPSYVMLNLDAVTLDGNLKNAGQLQSDLQTVKNTANIDGFVRFPLGVSFSSSPLHSYDFTLVSATE